jgi:anti-sigma28 factor (negative regulator of flagellin synthesis)
LSPEALAIGNQSSGEVFRADRVAELRQAIAEGNYDSDEMMTKALSKMLERLG